MQENLWFEHIFDNDDNVDKDNNLVMLLRRNRKTFCIYVYRGLSERL